MFYPPAPSGLKHINKTFILLSKVDKYLLLDSLSYSFLYQIYLSTLVVACVARTSLNLASRSKRTKIFMKNSKMCTKRSVILQLWAQKNDI